jgi:hypothetical protein
MKNPKDLTLTEAQKRGRLQEFIEQEEGRGIGPVDMDELTDALKAVIKPPRPEDRTSRSASRGGSSGKQTR